jgi:methyl-accepting chemotaxis protein
VTEAVDKINKMVAEIKNAIDSQSWESDNILRATDHMQTITSNVKKSIVGQSSQGQEIYRVIKDVSEKMHVIINSIREHKDTSERAVKAIEVIRSNSAENASRAQDLDQMVESLSMQASLLKNKVESFNV